MQQQCRILHCCCTVFVGKSISWSNSVSNSERYGCLVVSEGVGLARKSIEFLPTTAPTPTGENSSYSFLSSFLTTATGGFQLQSSHQDEAVICTVLPSLYSLELGTFLLRLAAPSHTHNGTSRVILALKDNFFQSDNGFI